MMLTLPVPLLLATIDYAVLLVEGIGNRVFSASSCITRCWYRDVGGRAAVNGSAARENSCCP
jgi:hypothetical protein